MEKDTTPEILTAFLDGELPPEEMERVAMLLDARPDLDQWVRRQERLRADLKQAVADLPPPSDRLMRTVMTSPISWRWRLRHMGSSGALRILAPAGAALALGLVIGVALRPPGDIVLKSGQAVAQGALASMLDDRLASEGNGDESRRIGISFRARDGRYCRTFDAASESGLACHGDKGWAIALLTARPAEQSQGAYRMAGSEMPDAIRAAVTASIAGEPFDAAAEKAARDRGWK